MVFDHRHLTICASEEGVIDFWLSWLERQHAAVDGSQRTTPAETIFTVYAVFISVRAKGAGGGGGSPPVNYFSGKTAKIYVISKRFSGKMFGQTGFLPPQVGKFFGQRRPKIRAKWLAQILAIKRKFLGTFF